MDFKLNLGYINSTTLSDDLCEKFNVDPKEARRFVKELTFSNHRTLCEYFQIMDYDLIQELYPNLKLREATADRGINGASTGGSMGGGASDQEIDDISSSYDTPASQNTTTTPQSKNTPIKVEPGIGGKRPSGLQKTASKFIKGFNAGKDPNKAVAGAVNQYVQKGDDANNMAKFRGNGTLNPNMIKPGTELKYRDSYDKEHKGSFVQKKNNQGQLIVRNKDGQDYEISVASVYEDTEEDNSELDRILELSGIEVSETSSAGSTGAGGIATANSIIGDVAHTPSDKLGKKRNEKRRKKTRKIRKNWGNE